MCCSAIQECLPNPSTLSKMMYVTAGFAAVALAVAAVAAGAFFLGVGIASSLAVIIAIGAGVTGIVLCLAAVGLKIASSQSASSTRVVVVPAPPVVQEDPQSGTVFEQEIGVFKQHLADAIKNKTGVIKSISDDLSVRIFVSNSSSDGEFICFQFQFSENFKRTHNYWIDYIYYPIATQAVMLHVEYRRVGGSEGFGRLELDSYMSTAQEHAQTQTDLLRQTMPELIK